jgi:AraC-like DNA-binding protein
VKTAMCSHDEVCDAFSWDELESLARLQPLSVVVFSPAADGTMDTKRACRLIRRFASLPFVAYVPVDAAFVRGIAHMAHEGLREVVVYRSDDSPHRFRKTLEQVSLIPQICALLQEFEPWFRRMSPALVQVLIDVLRQPHKYGSAEDVAAEAGVTLSALYRSFRASHLASPKSFVIGARVFRGYLYLCDSGFSITDVAVKLRYTHPRIFARHTETVLGECPSRIRYSLELAEVVRRTVDWFGLAVPLNEGSDFKVGTKSSYSAHTSLSLTGISLPPPSPDRNEGLRELETPSFV